MLDNATLALGLASRGETLRRQRHDFSKRAPHPNLKKRPLTATLNTQTKRGAYMADLKGTTVTWLGHATVHIATAKGTSILIDPFIEHNPKFPKGYKLPEKIDLILATHGHGDHVADLVSVALKHNSTVVGMVELMGWAQSKGVKKTIGMNLGGSWSYE